LRVGATGVFAYKAASFTFVKLLLWIRSGASAQHLSTGFADFFSRYGRNYEKTLKERFIKEEVMPI